MRSDATILHADLDSFYASVEQRDDPALRGRPVAVGGAGVILAASYEAKRRGVYTPMPGWKARQLCPDLIIVGGRFEAYTAASEQVFAIFHDTTPLVEGLSVDEAFLDVAGLGRVAGTPTAIAERLRQRVRAEVGPALEASLVETHLLQRVAGAFEAHGRRASDYAQHLSLYVWTLPFVAGAVGAVRALTMPSARVPGVLLSAFAAGHYLLFGVISRNFLPWYVLSAVPVVVVLASTLFGRGSTYWVRAVLLGTVLASLAKDLGVDPVALGLFGAALAVVFDWRPVPDVVPTFVLVAAFAGSALVLRPSVVREHPARLVEAVEERETLVVLESWKQFVWRCYLPEADFQVAGRECTEVRRIVTASEARFVITAPALDRCELHHQGFKRVAIDDGYVLHVREPRGVVWEPPTPPKKLPRPRRQAQ